MMAMRKYRIRGGNRVSGELTVGGAKNAALPILAALVLSEGESVIYNCPKIADIDISNEILKHLGCHVTFNENTLAVKVAGINCNRLPLELMSKMRSSVLFMGALLGRCGEVTLANPGGCKIGARPIDLHISGLEKLGVQFSEEDGLIHARTDKLVGNTIYLKEISVGATENLMLAAVLAEGETTLYNAAREPEIVDLAKFLIAMGAMIYGAGTGTIRINGVKKLQGTRHRIMPDRIVTGTFMLAAAVTKGDITLRGINPFDIRPITAGLLAMGCDIKEKPAAIRLRAPRFLHAIPHLITEAHPGFPTDMQAPFVAAFTLAKGVTVMEERIFESRAAHAAELIRLGANITVTSDNKTFVIKGRPYLTGAAVEAHDLRGGAALVLAGLAAEGETVVTDNYYIERGYERLEVFLRGIGADIRVE